MHFCLLFVLVAGIRQTAQKPLCSHGADNQVQQRVETTSWCVGGLGVVLAPEHPGFGVSTNRKLLTARRDNDYVLARLAFVTQTSCSEQGSAIANKIWYWICYCGTIIVQAGPCALLVNPRRRV